MERFINIPPRVIHWWLIIFHSALKEAKDDSTSLHPIQFSLEVFPIEAALFGFLQIQAPV